MRLFFRVCKYVTSEYHITFAARNKFIAVFPKHVGNGIKKMVEKVLKFQHWQCTLKHFCAAAKGYRLSLKNVFFSHFIYSFKNTVYCL